MWAWARARRRRRDRSPSSSGAWARARSATAFSAVDARALAAAAGIGVVTTVCCAWRWTIVARGLGVHLPLPAAVAAYYRSLFLNLTLPGGVVGDVHRGLSHGRDARDVGRALRAVAWERTAGQVVQAVLTVVVLLALPSPVRSYMPLVARRARRRGDRRRARRAGRGRAAARSRLGAAPAHGRPATFATGCVARRALPAIVLASARGRRSATRPRS